jgi:hypothetical protein
MLLYVSSKLPLLAHLSLTSYFPTPSTGLFVHPLISVDIYQLTLSMHSKVLTIAALLSAAYAQSNGLAAALSSNSQTSQLATLLGTLPGITNSLSSLSNITLLAPSNSALETLLNSSAGAGLAANPDLLQAV